LLYGFGVSFRNMLYDSEILKPTKFSIPLISIGNLSIGGAGKTPHVEYLISLLHPYINIATLSRGYNRKTTGFRIINPNDDALTAGDEPLMYARKYQGLPVAVGENRALAIPQLIKFNPSLQTVILDDAYQHRSVTPYINILLTQYESPFFNDYLLPSGRLREWRASYGRADVIIITKCPDDLDENKSKEFISQLKPKTHQKVFFTKYEYGHLYQFYHSSHKLEIEKDHDVIVISAIANTSYLEKYISSKAGSFLNIAYEDHHNFESADIASIIDVFNKRESKIKYIITTEKDAVRLQPYMQTLYENKIPIYVLPVKVKFLFDGDTAFNKMIKERLLEFES
jgi:tetraacyldisaccharide 4'-kinase